MTLIIDIPEEDYEFIKSLRSLIIGGRGNCKTIQKNVINAIRNGVPYEERPQGEWIVGDVYPIKYFCKCSNCGTKYVTSVSGDVSIIDFNFCPNCGSDMRGEENEKEEI